MMFDKFVLLCSCSLSWDEFMLICRCLGKGAAIQIFFFIWYLPGTLLLLLGSDLAQVFYPIPFW